MSHVAAVAGLAIAVVMGLFGVSAASASNWAGETNLTGCNLNMTENSAVAILGFGLSSATANAVSWVRTNDLDPTDLTTSTPSSASYADVVVYDSAYDELCGLEMYSAGGGYVAVTMCTTKHTVGPYAGRCNVHEVLVDQGYIDDAGTSSERKLLCHELGHTLSLEHTEATGTCMKTGNTGITMYNSHDVAHINANY